MGEIKYTCNQCEEDILEEVKEKIKKEENPIKLTKKTNANINDTILVYCSKCGKGNWIIYGVGNG